MWTTIDRAAGRCSATCASNSANDMHRSSGCSRTNSGRRARACTTASGVAMNVFDGHSTVRPRTLGALQRGQRGAGPAREGDGAEPVPCAYQAASNALVSGPSDQRWEAITPSQSSCRRARSRSSKPIANRAWSAMAARDRPSSSPCSASSARGAGRWPSPTAARSPRRSSASSEQRQVELVHVQHARAAAAGRAARRRPRRSARRRPWPASSASTASPSTRARRRRSRCASRRPPARSSVMRKP